MKKPLLIPLIASSVLLGCQDSKQSDHENKTQTDSILQHKITVAKWVGEYQGTTPCMSCISRCEECPGMAVDLVLNQDQTYTLKRESLSGHNEVEILTGRFRFSNQDQSKLELIQVKTRHLIYVDLEQQLLEILQDNTGHLYASEADFILEKKV
ncbi:copper resistance protein NlpE N-terminal domain-containing protein [Acinetobacter kyonggiensis]|uniref:NlpE N-terminal domain-containing protein n=1 Tax=Acinetobacter kyonggiensis TaxID=595670 RepID=A0A1H3ICS7_9GAMM|nr:copper resistance protein NlpE N-terminal domain-containing protein [Acinetobacter kyonggiensis]SDY25540.1 NlpE N-terminal domain-containing protein [Acinetobacter kyonggiensis]